MYIQGVGFGSYLVKFNGGRISHIFADDMREAVIWAIQNNQ